MTIATGSLWVGTGRRVVYGFSLVAACLILIVLWPIAAVSGDPPSGEALYNGTCTVCHDASFHTRPDRKVSNYVELLGRVDRCQESIDEGWSPDQVQQVADYLDDRYYHFKSDDPGP